MSGGSWPRARTAAAVIAVLASAPAAAQSGADVTTEKPKQAAESVLERTGVRGAEDRSLNGHVFTPATLARSPFAVTAFQADLVYGTGDATGPTYDVNGNVTGSRNYSFALMGQSFAYDKKLLDGVSAGIGAVTELDSGIDGPSALVVGAEIGLGAFGRVTAGHRFGPLQAAATFDASYAPRLGILVLEAVKRAIDTGQVAASNAFNQTNAWTLRPGVAVAFAPIKALGLTGSFDYQWVTLDTPDAPKVDEAGVDASLAADLDFGTFTSFPVALVAAWRWTEPVGSDGVDSVNAASGGVFYTGRSSLVLGLEVGHRSFTVRNLDSTTTFANIRLQYLW